MKYKKFLFTLITTLMLLMLYGCAISPPQPPVVIDPHTSWRYHQTQLEAITHWSIQGRLGVTYGNEGGSAALNWNQFDDRYHIFLHGPLGASSVHLNGDEHQVVLRSASGDRQEATTPDELVRRYLGWPIPLSKVRYWARGLPGPGKVTALHVNQRGFMDHLEQDGFVIDISSHQQVSNVYMPRKLKIINKNLSIKLIIKKWDLL